MSQVSLMDIINIEYSLGNKIMQDCNNIYSLKCINNTCKIFNKITKEDMAKHREEYYLWFLPNKIEETIENKMLSLLKGRDNYIVYKTPDEYNKDLEKLASKINEYNYYDSILEKMIKLYAYNYADYDISRNITPACYISGIIMKEFYNFITYHLKSKIKRMEFDNEEEEICDMVMKYKKRIL